MVYKLCKKLNKKIIHWSSYSGPHVWNSLSDDVRNSATIPILQSSAVWTADVWLFQSTEGVLKYTSVEWAHKASKTL